MRAPRLPTVRVLVRADVRDRDADHAALLALAASVLGCGPDAVRLDQRCGHCGAADHGALRVSDAPLPVAVGLSRSDGVVVLAATLGTSLGIDVERTTLVAAAPVDAVTAHEARGLGRAADRAWALTRLWTAKEAVLKRDGRGLRVDPLDLEVRWRGDSGRVRWRTGPAWTRHVRIKSVAIGADVVLAVATDGPVTIEVDRADAQSSGTAFSDTQASTID